MAMAISDRAERDEDGHLFRDLRSPESKAATGSPPSASRMTGSPGASPPVAGGYTPQNVLSGPQNGQGSEYLALAQDAVRDALSELITLVDQVRCELITFVHSEQPTLFSYNRVLCI